MPLLCSFWVIKVTLSLLICRRYTAKAKILFNLLRTLCPSYLLIFLSSYLLTFLSSYLLTIHPSIHTKIIKTSSSSLCALAANIFSTAVLCVSKNFVQFCATPPYGGTATAGTQDAGLRFNQHKLLSIFFLSSEN